jgi:hypothetical protein
MAAAEASFPPQFFYMTWKIDRAVAGYPGAAFLFSGLREQGGVPEK